MLFGVECDGQSEFAIENESLNQIAYGVGFSIGPTIGALIFELAGFEAVFWILGSVTALLFLIVVWVVPNIEDSDKQQTKAFLDLIMIPGVFVLFLHCIVLGMTRGIRAAGDGQWFSSQFAIAPLTLGLIFIFKNLIYILGSTIAGKLTSKGLVYTTMIIGYLLFIVGGFLFGPSPLLDFIFHGNKFFWLSTVFACMVSMTSALLYVPTLPAILSLAQIKGHSADNLHTYGMTMGLLTCGLSIGTMSGPIIQGAITQALDYPWALTVAALIAATMIMVLVIYLIIMKLTNQPLTPEEIDATEVENVSEKALFIADKLEKQFNESMEGESLIVAPQQQQLSEYRRKQLPAKTKFTIIGKSSATASIDAQTVSNSSGK